MKIITDTGEEMTIEHVRAAEFGPRDIIILRHPFQLSESAYAQLKEEAKNYFPENKVLVLEDGLDVEILREVQNGKP